jgi:hypothetical protein
VAGDRAIDGRMPSWCGMPLWFQAGTMFSRRVGYQRQAAF